VNLIVNGTTKELRDDATVAQLVAELAPGRRERGTAVAVNGEVVPKTKWDTARLSSGDRIEVLHAIGGG
jgi:sulfur carrier protein